MLDDGHVRLQLDLVPGSEPVRGRLLLEDGGSWTFTGWLALAAAIDAARRSIDQSGPNG